MTREIHLVLTSEEADTILDLIIAKLSLTDYLSIREWDMLRAVKEKIEVASK